jgi:hypothetical protein
MSEYLVDMASHLPRDLASANGGGTQQGLGRRLEQNYQVCLVAALSC